MGVAGGLKREGPKVSARKQGWEGRGDVPKVRKVQGSLKTRDFGGAGTHRCATQEESSCCRARSRAKSMRVDSGAHGEASAAALVAWEEVKR